MNRTQENDNARLQPGEVDKAYNLHKACYAITATNATHHLAFSDPMPGQCSMIRAMVKMAIVHLALRNFISYDRADALIRILGLREA